MPHKKPPELTFQQHIADSHCSTPRVRFGHAGESRLLIGAAHENWFETRRAGLSADEDQVVVLDGEVAKNAGNQNVVSAINLLSGRVQGVQPVPAGG